LYLDEKNLVWTRQPTIKGKTTLFHPKMCFSGLLKIFLFAAKLNFIPFKVDQFSESSVNI